MAPLLPELARLLLVQALQPLHQRWQQLEALLGAVWRPELLLRLQRRLPLVVLFTGYGNGSLINRYSPVKEQRGYLNALGDNGFYIMGAFILAD